MRKNEAEEFLLKLFDNTKKEFLEQKLKASPKLTWQLKETKQKTCNECRINENESINNTSLRIYPKTSILKLELSEIFQAFCSMDSIALCSNCHKITNRITQVLGWSLILSFRSLNWWKNPRPRTTVKPLFRGSGKCAQGAQKPQKLHANLRIRRNSFKYLKLSDIKTL